MAYTEFAINNKWFREVINQQAKDLFFYGKKPTIKDPFLTFLWHFYSNSIMVGILKERGK